MVAGRVTSRVRPSVGERRLVEARGAVEIGDADRDVIDHAGMIRKSLPRT